MKMIDLSTWKRKEVYEFYKDLDMPRYSVTVEMDITGYFKYLKSNQLPINLGIIHLIMAEMNKISNFRYRITKDGVVECDTIHPSFTDKIDDGDLFKIVNAPFIDDLSLFCANAKEASDKQGNKFIKYEDETRVDLVYITTFIWARYTQITNAYHLDKLDSIPRVTIGKIELVNDRRVMPLTIEAHHSLADGYHMGTLLQKIQSSLNQYEK